MRAKATSSSAILLVLKMLCLVSLRILRTFSNLSFNNLTLVCWGKQGLYSPVLPPVLMHANVSSPFRFEASWDTFEFANQVVQVKSNLVIVTLAWPTCQDPRLFNRALQDPDMETLTHWVLRLEPLIRQNSDEEVIVVFANRTGSEDEVLYAGSSAVLGIKGGEVIVYGILGRRDCKLLVVDTEKEPYGKLICRPEAGTAPYLAPFENLDPHAAASAHLPISKVSKPGEPTCALGKAERLAAHLNHPKASLKTKPDDLELPAINVVTPTDPSPTPLSQRPQIPIPSVNSWTQRYVYAQMKFPAPHPMELSPPPFQTFGRELTICQSPLYSTTGESSTSPGAIANQRKPKPSPTDSDSTIFTGLSPLTDTLSPLPPLPPLHIYDILPAPNASASHQQLPGPAIHTIDEVVTSPVAKKVTVKISDTTDTVTQRIPKMNREEGSKLRKDCPPVTDPQSTKSGNPSTCNNLRTTSSKMKKPLGLPLPLLPLTYSIPRAQRIEELSQRKPPRLRSPSCHESPRREKTRGTSGSSRTRFRSESRGGTERGRSPGARTPATQPTSRITASTENREGGRGRSRAQNYEGYSPAPRSPSMQNTRSKSARPIDPSRSRIVEERPCPNCAIKGGRSRSASRSKPSQRVCDDPERSSSARPTFAGR